MTIESHKIHDVTFNKKMRRNHLNNDTFPDEMLGLANIWGRKFYSICSAVDNKFQKKAKRGNSIQ